MQNTFITTSVIATALALTSVVAIGADAANRSRSDFGQKGSQAIVGKLVSLSDYLGKDDQAATSTSRTTASSSSQTTPRSEGGQTQLGSQAGKSGGLAGARNESTTLGGRDQKDSQGSKVTDQSDNRLQATGFDSSNEQTLVLIAQQGGMGSAQAPSGGLTGASTNQTATGQFGSNQRNLAGTSVMSAGGQAYILVFGDDASSQAAYRKAKGMITEGSSNWATSGNDSADRIPVRGLDDARPGATRDYTQQAESAATGRTGQRDSTAAKWSKTGSEVRVTGELVGRGGIQAIRVSEISPSSIQSDSPSKSPGSADPTSPSHNNSGKPESNDKNAR